MRHLGFTMLCGLLSATAIAQPQIGGGTCSTATLMGNFATSITGRQLGASGAGMFGAYLSGNGTANFDGENAVTLKLTVNTNQAAGVPLNWSGTYTVQANCVGQISITTGGSVTLNIAIGSVNLTNETATFSLSGGDATYTYSGAGSPQPTGCSTATLAGVYALSANGVFLTAGVVGAPYTSVGLMQFDGQGNLTVNGNAYGAGANTMLTWTGTYTVANCVGAGTLTDTNGHTVNASFSVTAENSIYTSNIDVTFARSAHYIASGAGHAIYGQPSAAGGPPTAPAPVGNQIGGGSCNASMLKGTYSLSNNGRQISAAGTLTSNLEEAGLVTFDGVGTFTYSATAAAPGQTAPIGGQGTYTVSSNCTGTANTTGNNPGTFELVVYNSGRNVNLAGMDANYVYSGSGVNQAPPLCGTATISGTYSVQATGVATSGSTIEVGFDQSGVFQSDGQGNLTGNLTTSVAGMSPQQATLSGTYSVMPNCQAIGTVKLPGGQSTSLSLVINGPHGENLVVMGFNPSGVFLGSAHSAFTNPSQAITNVASYGYSATPPGSVFALFGSDLATKSSAPGVVPLETTILGTSVLINGNAVPLFYVDPGQIDAQVPWEVQGGTLATVVVKNSAGSSNAAALYVPASATPGLSFYSNNRAVVVNQDGNVNSADDVAHVGDEEVLYFTGGGPVNPAGKLVSGSGSPAGLSPVTDTNPSVTVGGMQAEVFYVGLTSGSIGLYQANFKVPQLTKGAYPVVLTIDGVSSNNILGTYYPNPVMNVGN